MRAIAFPAEVSRVVTLGYDANYGDNITATIGWKNNQLNQGAQLYVGFLLGKGGYMYYFTANNVDYLIGAMAQTTAPAKGSSATKDVLTKAAFSYDTGYWDGLAFACTLTGQVTYYSWDGRMIGINKDEFLNNTSHYGYKWFTDVLKVVSQAQAELTSLTFKAG